MLQSVKISELPSAGTLTEDDLIVIDQPDNTKKATLFQVLNHLEDSVEQSTLAVLGSSEEGMGGDLVRANQANTVSDILRRMRTLGDIGAERPVWGYDTTNDVKIYNAQAGEGADDIMMNGGFFLARKFRGTSRFAVVSGIRGGACLC